jgi:hypothetical protein
VIALVFDPMVWRYVHFMLACRWKSFNSAVRNGQRAISVASGFSSHRKCPASTCDPLTSVAHVFHVSSGVAAAEAMPCFPHATNRGQVILFPLSRSALSCSKSA